MKTAILFSLLSLLASSSAVPTSQALTFVGPGSVQSNGAHNIHVSYSDPDALSETVILVYGDCDIKHHSASHHEVGRFDARDHVEKPTRFVWLTPSDLPAGQCLHAFTETTHLGRSISLEVRHATPRKRNTLASINDPYGAWFDGVTYLKSQNQTAAFIAGKKDQKIAILGGGMSGLMSALLLDQVGIHNWEISESSNRIGGRLRTAYLNGTAPDAYQYQEMGPMRFPVSLTDPKTNETIEINDHKLVFQLADVLNGLNKQLDPSWQVNFIPWIQSNSATFQYQNGLRNPDGTAPRRSQYPALLANASLPAVAANPRLAAARVELTKFIGYENKAKAAATNLFKAHKQAIADGLLDFSEVSYLKAQGLGWNETSAAFSSGYLWSSIYDGVYFAATKWLTIDKGLNRIAEAFHPIVDNRLTLGRRIERISYNETTKKTGVTWYKDGKLESKSYDKTLVAVPFSVARLWRKPALSPIMSEAVSSLGYASACKVALLYKTRFWEKLSPPIYGGCGATDLPGVGSFCYPAYNLNGTGPGALLASYDTGTGPFQAARSEADHVRSIVEAMEEIHGPIAKEQYTGIYDRQCWGIDQNAAGSWASPYPGQHQRYMPQYHMTHSGHVFIGEHTSINHAWIFSALESSVRGVVQLLLDDGLVDEAQQVDLGLISQQNGPKKEGK